MVFLLIFILIQDFICIGKLCSSNSSYTYASYYITNRIFLKLNGQRRRDKGSGASAKYSFPILHLGNHRFKVLHVLYIGNALHRCRHAKSHKGDEENHHEDIGRQSNEE